MKNPIITSSDRAVICLELLLSEHIADAGIDVLRVGCHFVECVLLWFIDHKSVLVILWEHSAQTQVDRAEDDGVGHDLDNVGLARRQGQEDARRQQDEENHGDNYVGVDHLYLHSQKYLVTKAYLLMVKHRVYTLANRALRMNQEMSAQLTRIQSGFLAGKNIEQAQETIRNMQEMLREMQDALHAPTKTDSFTPPGYIPLK